MWVILSDYMIFDTDTAQMYVIFFVYSTRVLFCIRNFIVTSKLSELFIATIGN